MGKIYNVYVYLCWSIVYLKQCHADMVCIVFSLQKFCNNSGNINTSEHDTWINMKLLCMEIIFSKVAALYEVKYLLSKENSIIKIF